MTTDQPPEPVTHLRNHWYWRPGWREGRAFYTWHLTFEGQSELHRLVGQYQAALRDVPGLDLIPLEWLHLTMQGVGFIDDITPVAIEAIADAVREHIAQLPRAELTFHRPAMRLEAITLPPAPTKPLFMIRDAIRLGIATIWGNDHIPETSNRFDPHLSIAYANTEVATAGIFTALTVVEPEPVTAAIAEVSLIVLHREDRLYRWDTFDRMQLGC